MFDIDAIAYYKDWVESVDVAIVDVEKSIEDLATASINDSQSVMVICEAVGTCHDLIKKLHERLVAVERELAALKAAQ